MRVTVGEVIFLRLQGWLVILVYLFKPNLGHAVRIGRLPYQEYLGYAHNNFVALGTAHKPGQRGQFF
jgi:hypothetical protein